MTEPAGLPETIVLVGAPGSGKTTTGQRLAKALERDFLDVDQLIEAEQGTTIGDIFVSRGEPVFRELEREATLRVLNRPGVVSLGGGAVMNAEIREALGRTHVVWLQVSAQQASRRVGITGASRPLLAGGVHNTLVRLMNERLPLYEQVATQRVDTNGLRPAGVTRVILAALGHTWDPQSGFLDEED